MPDLGTTSEHQDTDSVLYRHALSKADKELFQEKLWYISFDTAASVVAHTVKTNPPYNIELLVAGSTCVDYLYVYILPLTRPSRRTKIFRVSRV